MKRHEILSKEVECSGMEDRLMGHEGQMKAKDLFNIMSVMERDGKPEMVGWLVKQIEGVVPTMIPEEVVILNTQLQRLGLQARVSPLIEAYIQDSREEMETLELAKVYMSCIKSKLELSEAFRREVDELLLVKKLPGCDAASLPYIIPLLLDTKIESKPEPA